MLLSSVSSRVGSKLHPRGSVTARQRRASTHYFAAGTMIRFERNASCSLEACKAAEAAWAADGQRRFIIPSGWTACARRPRVRLRDIRLVKVAR